jgi:hypothetical protein
MNMLSLLFSLWMPKTSKLSMEAMDIVFGATALQQRQDEGDAPRSWRCRAVGPSRPRSKSRVTPSTLTGVERRDLRGGADLR